MLLGNSFAQQRRLILLGLASALLSCTLFVLPQSQALASALVLLFRGQTIQPIPTDYAHLQNAYRTLEELEHLGTRQGTLPGLSRDTAAALQNISSWQTTIPLGIPTDRVGWTSTTVAGALGGSGVVLDDDSGIASAVLWERGNHMQSLGVGGWGIKASEVLAVASSLH